MDSERYEMTMCLTAAAYDAWVQRAKCRRQQPCIAVIESRIFRRVGLIAELLSNPPEIESQLTSRHDQDHVSETSRSRFFPAPCLSVPKVRISGSTLVSTNLQ
jgi:hypothetical protein